MIYTDFEIEHCLLGGLIYNNAAMAEIRITADDFAYAENQEIFRHMEKCFVEKQRFSVPDFKLIEPEEGYVRACVDSVVGHMTSQLVDYADHLTELSRKRRLAAILDDASRMMEDSSSADVMAFFSGASEQETASNELKTGEDVLREIVEALEKPSEKYSTGIPCLDKAMAGGLYAGFTYGFAGSEKSGKTTLAHTISCNLPCRHLYIALEMGSLQIEQRNIARRIGFNSLKFITPDKDFEAMVKAQEANRNVIYYDAPGATLEQILRHIGLARIKYGINGFILDYWQLVGGKKQRETEEAHTRYVAQELANYARKHKLFNILLAQQNQEGRLFGGNGLRKACDQLYFIEKCDSTLPDAFRWLKMDASRYTNQEDIGSKTDPALSMNWKKGPHFEEAKAYPLI